MNQTHNGDNKQKALPEGNSEEAFYVGMQVVISLPIHTLSEVLKWRHLPCA